MADKRVRMSVFVHGELKFKSVSCSKADSKLISLGG